MALDRHFKLIRTGQTPQKRTLPRFPYCYLNFKSSKGESDHVFEVKDISLTGMQLALKDGDHQFEIDQKFQGKLHWGGEELAAHGKVKWIHGRRVGMEFDQDDISQAELRRFLSTKNIIKNLRAVHDLDLGLEVPANLKYWLRSDGPVKLYMWIHSDGEFSKFQMILFSDFVEWEDGEGVQTGVVLTKRDVDTPLISEDEFVFQTHEENNTETLDKVVELVKSFEEKHIPSEVSAFLLRKLSHR